MSLRDVLASPLLFVLVAGVVFVLFVVAARFVAQQVAEGYRAGSTITRQSGRRAAYALTAGRIARIEKYLGDEKDFFLTYGDGVSDINITELIDFAQELRGGFGEADAERRAGPLTEAQPEVEVGGELERLEHVAMSGLGGAV